jgi:hypothetical protein
MSQGSDDPPAGSDLGKARKPWKKPELRRVKLEDDEVAALRQSDDPVALLRRMWPGLKDRQSR